MRLYVGNLPYSLSDQDLSELFSSYGEATSATVILDRDNGGRSKGFGFVEMEDTFAAAALELDGYELQGRKLTVNEARPREQRTHGDRRTPQYAGRPGDRGDRRERRGR